MGVFSHSLGVIVELMTKHVVFGFLFTILVGCQNKNELKLTHQFLNGNWCFIDSISYPDSDFSGYNYVEMSFNDSISIYYADYPGIGPFYQSYKLVNDSIIFADNQCFKIEIIDSNTVTYNEIYNKNQNIRRELTRMDEHSYPLKEFYNQLDLDTFMFEVRKRHYELLRKEKLIK